MHKTRTILVSCAACLLEIDSESSPNLSANYFMGTLAESLRSGWLSVEKIDGRGRTYHKWFCSWHKEDYRKEMEVHLDGLIQP